MCISEESVPGDVYNPTHETQLIQFSDQCLSECCDESLSNPYQPKNNFLKQMRVFHSGWFEDISGLLNSINNSSLCMA